MTSPLYFRCDRLLATLSVAACRANRARRTARQGSIGFADGIRPVACRDCPLAAKVDAGKVPLLTAEEVRQGWGLQLARKMA